ncbi:MAG: stage III sporulation protein AB [Oscillospiraceae bacterium]|nr:stage III sporulation protein AB [Oscillospiraceae bacterium]
MVLKYIGVIALAASAVLSGFYFSNSLNKRVAMLSAMLLFIEDVSVQIRYKQADIFWVLKHAVSMTFSKDLPFKNKLCEIDEELNEASVNQILYESGVTEDDQKLICEFFCGLGKSDILGQLSHCEMYAKLLSEQVKIAKFEADDKGRLYRALSLFGSAAVVILLI